jgi:glutamine amidotransferase
MFTRVGTESIISNKPEDLENASRLVLPGVGAFDAAMRRLQELDIISILRSRVVDRGVPILGICLGMQLMSLDSEEGQLPGLGWIQARTKRFQFSGADSQLKVPHMGWNRVAIQQQIPLLHGLSENPRFYFVHSYHVACERQENVLTTTHYGIDFHSAFAVGNIFGTQFHPEKSHKFGMKILENFITY